MAAKKQTGFVGLPEITIVDVVAKTPDGKVYIFDMYFGEWLKIKKKPGVVYTAFQKGFSNYPDAIRTEYKK